VSPAGERFEQSRLASHSGCNNEAELHALIAGLEFARSAGARSLLVRSDSDFVIAHVAGKGVTKIQRLTELIGEAQSALGGFSSVDLEWIPRHRNPEADRLSRQAVGLPEKPASVPGKTKRRK